jgi:coenzyme F420 hydrogenase subunit beta
MDSIVPSGCMVCQDFTGVESDVSVGSIGSSEGFSTVIVRTTVGKKVIDFIREKGTADFADADIGAVEKSCNLKIKMHPFPKEG